MLFCPDCGYDLQGITSDRCPECGFAIDRDALARSQIPWSHRKQLGWWRAYWKTVWMVSRHPRKFAEEIQRPQSYREARRFRWITVALCVSPAALTLIVLLLTGIQWELRPLEWQPVPDNGNGIIAVALVAVVLAVVVLTGVQSYFFHPRSLPLMLQNRAITLSYYPCGILALFGLLASCGWGIFLAAERLFSAPGGSSHAPLVFRLAAIVLSGGANLALAIYLLNVLIVLRTITKCGIVRLALTFLAMIVTPTVTAAIVMALPGVAWTARHMMGF